MRRSRRHDVVGVPPRSGAKSGAGHQHWCESAEMTAASNQARVGRSGAVTFHHPAAFWFGVVAVTAGVLLHIPMYLMGQRNGYRLACTMTGCEAT